jgi:metallo-beta-lactamase family protein
MNNPAEVLETHIRHTLSKKGSLYIPAFAVQRSQDVLYLLGILLAEKRIPEVPIIFDSPMGTEISRLMLEHKAFKKLREDAFLAIMSRLQVISRSSDSERISAEKKPKIVVAGSGMLTGGRMLQYLENALADPSTTLLLSGYQSEGTRGRDLLDGAPEIKFYGQYHPVKCKVAILEGLSGHADRDELTRWVKTIKPAPNRVFLNHGEADASYALQLHLSHELHLNAIAVKHGDIHALS